MDPLGERLDADPHLGRVLHALDHPVAFAGDFDHPLDRLAIAHARLVDLHVEIEVAQQPMLDHFQVQLAHAADQRLARLAFSLARNVGSCLRSMLECLAQLLAVVGALRLDRHRDDRLGKLDRFEQDRLAGVAQRVAGDRVAEADHADDVAGPGLGDLLFLSSTRGSATAGRRFPSCPCRG